MSGALPDTGFRPNFSSNHSVVLDQPIAQVFSIIGTSEGHERTTRLSGLCSGFELLHSESITIPKSTALSDTHIAYPSLPSVIGEHELGAPTRKLRRQFFKLKETVPILFGMLSTDVHLSGSLTWDAEEKVSLYESKTDSGILVWKCRIFEEVASGKTRVSERILGKCPCWLRGIVQNQATTAHM